MRARQLAHGGHKAGIVGFVGFEGFEGFEGSGPPFENQFVAFTCPRVLWTMTDLWGAGGLVILSLLHPNSFPSPPPSVLPESNTGLMHH